MAAFRVGWSSAEWSTYTLSDFLLFSPETYFRLFELYNAAIWPAQLLALVVGGVILMLLLRLSRVGMMATRVIALLLALAWAWVAWAFHLEHYASINWAAPWFAAAFALQTLLLVVFGLTRRHQTTHAAGRVMLGRVTLAYALLLHPLVGLLAGRSVSQLGVFGSAPDPTVIATLGVVLALPGAWWILLPIPLLWCAIGGATLWAMHEPEAWVMPVVAVVTLVGLRWRR